MAAALSPAVFLDRDGTLIEDVPYGVNPEKVRLFPGVREALARLLHGGFKNVIITNQSGIGRGWITQEQYEAVHARLIELLGGQLIAATYYSPDAPGAASETRKPAPGLVLAAAHDLELDLARSWFIGDKSSDVQCAHNAGVRPILLLTGEGAKADRAGAEFIAPDFTAAAEFILQNHGQ